MAHAEAQTSWLKVPLTMQNPLKIDLELVSNNRKITAWISMRTTLGRAGVRA
jgi:hypothetical protein